MDRFVLALCLCLISTLTFARDPLPAADVASIIDEFSDPVSAEIVRDKQKGGFFSQCWVQDQLVEVKSDSLSETMMLEQRLNLPNRYDLDDKKIPVVIILPPIGGVNLLDRNLSTTVCENGMAALILANDFANIESQSDGKLLPPEDHTQSLYRAVAGIRAALKTIEADENLDLERVGIFGTSLGGILGSFSMAVIPEISGGFFVVAGGDIPQILAITEQEETSRIRRKRMRAEGIKTVEEYEDFLREYITFDPIDVAYTMPKETLQMVIDQDDRIVPTANQEALHAAFGEPEAIYFADGHGWAIGQTFLYNQFRIMGFFKDRFAVENPRPGTFEFLEQFSLKYFL